jgi:hypothetical protein
MYRKRLKGYDAIGYSIQNVSEKFSQQPNQYEYVQRQALLDEFMLEGK